MAEGTSVVGNNKKVSSCSIVLVLEKNVWCLKKLLAKLLYGFGKKITFHFHSMKEAVKARKVCLEFEEYKCLVG